MASAMPSGYSGRTNNVVTITAPSASGNVNDMSVSISNGSGIKQGTNPSPGQTFTVRPASNVSGSGSTVQGQGQTGNLTSATVTRVVIQHQLIYLMVLVQILLVLK